MISSVEEFVLLLKKWSTERSQVRLIASFADPNVASCRGVLRLTGAVTAIDERTRVFRIGEGDQCAMIGFAGCRLGYGAGEDMELSSQLTDAEQLEDLICLMTPQSLSICLYTVK